MEYRGIRLNKNVKLYKNDGSFYKSIKNSLDDLANMLIKSGHELLSEYNGSSAKILIDFKCEHESHLILPSHYKNGIGCPKCGRNIASVKHSMHSRKDLINLIKKNGHELLSEYFDAKSKILIDFKCGHDPHEITPDNYKYGQGCPECGIIKKSEKQSKKAREELTFLLENNEHELLSKYINARTKVLVDFKCGHILFKKFKRYLQDCPMVEYVINESEDIIKEKEERVRELKEEIQRCCEKKQEISAKLLEEYNNLI
jgi:hypothetical protein